MKKFFSIIAIGAMTLSLSSFSSSVEEYNSCLDDAISYGRFMDGYNGISAAGHAFDFARTFCRVSYK